jgi:hypothetical protein
MTSPEWIAIEYREFHDLPRLVRITLAGVVYLLDCPFDDESDNYDSRYTVYRVSGAAAAEAERSRDWLAFIAPAYNVGAIPSMESDDSSQARN